MSNFSAAAAIAGDFFSALLDEPSALNPKEQPPTRKFAAMSIGSALAKRRRRERQLRKKKERYKNRRAIAAAAAAGGKPKPVVGGAAEEDDEEEEPDPEPVDAPSRLGLGNYASLGMDTYKSFLHDVNHGRGKSTKGLTSEMMLSRYAILLSHTYASINVFAHNVNGRVVVVGSKESMASKGERKIEIRAYTPQFSQTHKIHLGVEDITSLLEGQDMPELLKPGRKRDLVYEVTKFLYFDYVVTERWVRRKTDTHRDERYRVSTFSDLEPWDIRARGYIAAFDPHCPPKKREELPGDHLLSAEEVHHNDNDNDIKY